MTSITVTVTGTEVKATLTGHLTGGMVGVPVTFSFDGDWEGLVKVALFRAGGETYCIHEIGSRVTAPWEILEKAGCTLYVGVYGVSEDGSLAIPTLWAEVGSIQPGADPDATETCDPNLPVWKEALDRSRKAEEMALGVYKDAQAGAFDGYSPVRGVDYWTKADIKEIKSYVDGAILGGAW